jgi:pre-mRNA-splicing factor 38A
LNAESVVDKAVALNHIGGHYSNQKPTDFICLVMKLLQITPNKDIIKVYIQNEDFKYLRALGAFYLRLTSSPLECYQYLEPLLLDKSKLRYLSHDGSFHLTYMDVFVDDLLHQERVCDTILPRLTKRFVFEEFGELEPRVSILEEEEEDLLVDQEMEEDLEKSLEKNLDAQVPIKETVKEIENETINNEKSQDSSKLDNKLDSSKMDAGKELSNDKKKKDWSHKKVNALFKKSKKPADIKSNQNIEETSEKIKNKKETSSKGGFSESLSIQETNRMRISLGLKPLKE